MTRIRNPVAGEYEDRPVDDLTYIKFRLSKYARKTEFWSDQTDLSVQEVLDIDRYTHRIRAFLFEIKTELFPNAGMAIDAIPSSSLISIYDFDLEAEKDGDHGDEVRELCEKIEALIVYCEKNLDRFSTNDLVVRRKKLALQAGQTLPEDIRRGKQSEKKILLGLSVRMKNAMEEAATAEGVSDVTKWLRRLILERLFRYHRHDLDDFR